MNCELIVTVQKMWNSGSVQEVCVVDDSGKVAEGWEMLSFFLEGQTRRGWLDLSFDDSVTFGQARILPRCGCFDCRPPNNNTQLPAPASASCSDHP